MGTSVNILKGDLRLILASGSPRRKELLASLGWKFQVAIPSVDETIFPDEDISEAVKRISREKALDVHHAFPNQLILAADTVVCVDTAVLGKPRDPEDARRMISLLNDRTHKVITGVALCRDQGIVLSREITEVTFRSLDRAAIEAYLATGEGMDKAGAYAIQGKGSLLVKAITGCYYNVVGLPLHLVSSMMEKMGISLSTQWGS
ncbi:MAG: septum formation inhibitor Maf [Synergistales bacterium]|nr:septum formation inhibitor Maf [Synergistales bacterium]